MPKLSKARRVALQREETRRLERETSLKNALAQPAECLIVEAKVLQPRGGSRTSKWRDENQKTKKSRAARMQPSVLKFFSVSDRNGRSAEKLTRTHWLMGSRSAHTRKLNVNVRTEETVRFPR